MRQHNRAAHHLIRVFRIDAKTQRDLHGLVKLAEFHFLQKRHRFLQDVRSRLDLLASRSYILTDFLHLLFLVSHRAALSWRAVVLWTELQDQY